MKTLRCIERVHQRPVLAQVGNQTATLESDNEDWIARSWYIENSGGVCGIRADTGRRELEVTRQYRPRQLRMGRQFQDALRRAKVDPDIMRIMQYMELYVTFSEALHVPPIACKSACSLPELCGLPSCPHDIVDESNHIEGLYDQAVADDFPSWK